MTANTSLITHVEIRKRPVKQNIVIQRCWAATRKNLVVAALYMPGLNNQNLKNLNNQHYKAKRLLECIGRFATGTILWDGEKQDIYFVQDNAIGLQDILMVFRPNFFQSSQGNENDKIPWGSDCMDFGKYAINLGKYWGVIKDNKMIAAAPMSVPTNVDFPEYRDHAIEFLGLFGDRKGGELFFFLNTQTFTFVKRPNHPKRTKQPKVYTFEVNLMEY